MLILRVDHSALDGDPRPLGVIGALLIWGVVGSPGRMLDVAHQAGRAGLTVADIAAAARDLARNGIVVAAGAPADLAGLPDVEVAAALLAVAGGRE